MVTETTPALDRWQGLATAISWSPVRAARRVAGIVAFLVIWQAVLQLGVVQSNFVPAPLKVAETWATWVIGPPGQGTDRYAGTWPDHAMASTWRVLAGFAVAAFLGTLIGVAIGVSPVVSDVLDPLVQILRPIPTTAWVAFAVIFFGIGPASAIFLIALGAFFPVVLNTTHGVRQVPGLLLRSAAMLGTPRHRLLTEVVLPGAMPSVFVGLRLAIGVAWVLVIVAEMVAVKSGLGFVLWDAYQYLRVDIVVAAMLSVGLLGFISDRVVLAIGRWALRWQEREL